MAIRIYENIVDEALAQCRDDVVKDCAVGEKTLAVESGSGMGISMLYARSGYSRQWAHDLENEIRGMDIGVLARRYLENDPVYASLALAAINSILVGNGSTPAPDYHDVIPSKARLGLVGWFSPIVHYARDHGVDLTIFELRDLPGTFRPEEAPKRMPLCDIVIFTGSAFSNRSIHHYLPHIDPDAAAYILGPSTPLADCLGRFHLGSSRVLDKRRVFDAVREGFSCGDIRLWLQKTGRTAIKDRMTP
ncbi:DUF364 domain-containing protein [Oxalobacter vibrioformis]|uniref:DUF364 domain-containing protein n=1 Tax=Oxalobacter vibrioformis TaxID=933080 RepID=A0A9E9LWS9_9BURK|nr:DUF364 domain-containing protein [Oxalobacter vibrioformis]WAW10127.1 DUF364 domain-containing protein [Oxalobacter vibrioformis]